VPRISLENTDGRDSSAADAGAIEIVNEALSTVQRLTSSVKKSAGSDFRDHISSQTRSSQAASSSDNGAANEAEDILDLTAELILAKPDQGIVSIRSNTPRLIRGRRVLLGARSSSASGRTTCTGLLTGPAKANPKGLPRSETEEVASALNQAKAALRGISADSTFFGQRSTGSGTISGIAALGQAKTPGMVQPTASAGRMDPGSALTGDGRTRMLESREVIERLDAMTNQLAKLSMRIGALERLIEGSLGQTAQAPIVERPWRR
jgi:hypothetical protein